MSMSDKIFHIQKKCESSVNVLSATEEKLWIRLIKQAYNLCKLSHLNVLIKNVMLHRGWTHY